jgi:hypothetical protein
MRISKSWSLLNKVKGKIQNPKDVIVIVVLVVVFVDPGKIKSNNPKMALFG